MSLATNQAHLLHHQYQNAANLNARIALHAQFSVNVLKPSGTFYAATNGRGHLREMSELQ